VWPKESSGIGGYECFGILRYAQDDSKNKRQQEQTTARTNNGKNKQRQEQTRNGKNNDNGGRQCRQDNVGSENEWCRSCLEAAEAEVVLDE